MNEDELPHEPAQTAPEGSSFVPPPASLLRRYLPVLSFLGGFAWDAVTLGRSIKPLDLLLLLGYLAGASAILVAIGRGLTFRGSQYLNLVLQFFFGGIFSALLIFYFLSSSGLPGFLFVLGLAALLVGNEFLQNAYSELTLSWSFFTLSAIMFFNFALAHLFRSISTFWFYLGTLFAALLVLVIRRLSRHESASIRPSIAVVVLMLFLHVFNVIPPVPLVKKQMLVAHALKRSAGAYVAQVESPGWRFWRTSSATFHRQGSEPVYCFTSVFVPEDITTTIRHRWELYDEDEDEWTTTSVIPFRIAGGRQAGYRGYTYKQSVRPGRWRVTAEAESGAALGIIDFRVVPGTPAKQKTMRL
ncbi:MAG TPA: DUF2914 domain-containing protein [Thermoanaerobaculia bacterium]|jgi:hypothetical protein|nr:DUF2914 domain-containing protein [Thermoanaerobaculia bacterium]